MYIQSTYVCMYVRMYACMYVRTLMSSETTVLVSQVEHVSEVAVESAVDAVSNKDSCCRSRWSR